MTPVEIAYFKHFLFDKSLERTYVSYYRKYRIKGSPRGDKDGNPESIEQFFLKTTVRDVVMKAFTFHPTNLNARSNFTFDYWKEIDDKWQEYMKQNASNWTNESWPQLRKSFAILRQNWDVPAFWRRENFESTEEVYRRMHIDLPLPERCWGHGVESPKPDSPEPEPLPEQTTLPESTTDALEGFDFSEVRHMHGGGRKPDDDWVSLNARSGYRLLLCKKLSHLVIKQQFPLVRYASNATTREIALFFNHSQGIPLASSDRNSVTINSKDIVQRIIGFYGLKGDFARLSVSATIPQVNSLIIKLILQQ